MLISESISKLHFGKFYYFTKKLCAFDTHNTHVYQAFSNCFGNPRSTFLFRTVRKIFKLDKKIFMCYWTFVGRDPCSHWKGNVDISIWGAANSNWFCSRNYIPNLKEKKILHIIWNIYIYWEEKYKNVLMHAIWGMFYVEHWGRSSTIKGLAQLVIQQIIITKNE